MEDCSIETTLHRQAIVIGDTVDSSNIWGSPSERMHGCTCGKMILILPNLARKRGLLEKRLKVGAGKLLWMDEILHHLLYMIS